MFGRFNTTHFWVIGEGSWTGNCAAGLTAGWPGVLATGPLRCSVDPDSRVQYNDLNDTVFQSDEPECSVSHSNFKLNSESPATLAPLAGKYCTIAHSGLSSTTT